VTSAERPLDEIPPAVAFQAVNPSATGPAPPVETGAVRVLTARYCLFVTPMPTVNFVELLDVAPTAVAETVREVRDLLRTHGRRQAAWSFASTDHQLHAALAEHGMTPYLDPPLEPEFAAMAIVRAPLGAPSRDVEVRRAVELADFLVIGELANSVFGMVGEDAAALVEGMRRRHQLQIEGRTQMSTYFALIDGQVVGEAQAALTPTGSNLSGSSVRPEARGRGVYRALVAARWDEAVARGLPALTVQAGTMSRPILERLGFRTVATQLVLRDQF
jgi:GNAT superfamily N-acetyltransferase